MGNSPSTPSATLDQLCTADHVQASLPALDGISYGSGLTAQAVYNYNVVAEENFPAASGRNYCNVQLTYSHANQGDTIHLQYYLPDPTQYSHRFLATGGRGVRVNFGARALEQGLVYGAAAGLTDGGFTGIDAALVNSDGSLNTNALTSFSYLAIHEMTEIGRNLTSKFYGDSARVYSYFAACSEGGREGWSAAQRYATDYDGLAIGAPAMSQAYITPMHIFAQVYEQVNGYIPTLCELEKINNDTTAACDTLDGRADGVISRSDLCLLHYNATASIGSTFNCPADSSARPVWSFGSSSGNGAVPAQSGTVTAQGVAVYQAMIDGAFDSQNRHLYIGYLPGANSKYDGAGTYDANSNSYSVVASGVGAQWINLYLDQNQNPTVPLNGVTVDQMRTWISQGLQKYQAYLQDDNPDLSAVHNAGAKIIHYHGEADSSVPTLTSTLYHESVRRQMYGSLSYQDSLNAMNEFYRFYLVPGAQHCVPWAENGAYPDTHLQDLISWVENGTAPATLGATILQGPNQGVRQNLCLFPNRPQWSSNDTSAQPECVFPDQASLDVYSPTLDTIS